MISFNPNIRDLKPSLIRQMSAAKRSDSIDLSLGEPARRVDSDLWQLALSRYDANPQGYTPNLGMPALRSAIAQHYEVTADHVCVTVGSEEALFLVFFSLLAAGDEVVIADPAYPAYANLAHMCGATPVSVPLSGPHYSLRCADVAARCTTRTKLVVVSSPSNPLGRIDDAQELQALARLAEQRELTLLSDEIYADLWFDAQPVSVATFTPRAVRVSGLSKSCAMTGHRLGYVVAQPEFIKAIWPVHQLTVTSPPTLAQHLALVAFEQKALTRHRSYYAEQWSRVRTTLQRCGLNYIEPQGAFYVMLHRQSTLPSLAWCLDVLDKTNVVSVPGAAFGSVAEPWARLSFAGDIAQVCAGIERIATYIAKQPR